MIFGSLASAEAHRLASLSWNVGKGKPLKEHRGEIWFRADFNNCVEKPEKFRTSTGFEPVTSRFRCDALTN